jgi:hypothetical protein
MLRLCAGSWTNIIALCAASIIFGCSSDTESETEDDQSSGGSAGSAQTGGASNNGGADNDGGAPSAGGTDTSSGGQGGATGDAGAPGTGGAEAFVPPTVEPRTCTSTGTSIRPAACGEDVVACNELLIADLEAGTEINKLEGRSGGFFTFSKSGTITSSSALYSQDAHAGSKSSVYAAGQLVSGGLAAVGMQFRSGEHCSIDATYMDGIQFAAKGNGKVYFGLQEWKGNAETVHGAWRTLTPDWQVFKVRYSELDANGTISNYDGRSLLQLFWMFFDAGNFEIYIDDVYFFVDP